LEKAHIEPVTTQWNNASPSRAGCVARYWVHSIGHERSLKNTCLVVVSSQNVGIEMLLKKVHNFCLYISSFVHTWRWNLILGGKEGK
jgi:hypothetical protein